MPEQPNRYGRQGSENCCHGIALWKICGLCNDALARNKQRQEAGGDDLRLPTLIGTGDVLIFDEPKTNKEDSQDESEQG